MGVAGTNKGQRFVIAWNGLVCPVTKVGPTADVRKDALGPDRRGRGRTRKFAKDNPGATCQLRPNIASNLRTIAALSHKSLRPMKACLLLRMGHGDLAARSGTPGRSAPTCRSRACRCRSVPYACQEWSLLALGIAAPPHIPRGDDRMALSIARKLAASRAGGAASSEEGERFKSHLSRRRSCRPGTTACISARRGSPAALDLLAIRRFGSLAYHEAEPGRTHQALPREGKTRRRADQPSGVL